MERHRKNDVLSSYRGKEQLELCVGCDWLSTDNIEEFIWKDSSSIGLEH